MVRGGKTPSSLKLKQLPRTPSLSPGEGTAGTGEGTADVGSWDLQAGSPAELCDPLSLPRDADA